jgi:dTDP-4-dehydrorhamnose 3,5-epimerase
MSLTRTETAIPGVLILQSKVFHDTRGYFQETWNETAFREAGIDIAWKQDNLSLSSQNVVRGLHYQLVQPQAKLVRVVCGAVFDVAVDIRRSSPTFGQHVSVELREGDGKAFLIPAGFAHGFVTLEPNTIFMYKVGDFYNPTGDRTLLWNDPALGIAWPIATDVANVSEKDLLGKPLAEADIFD